MLRESGHVGIEQAAIEYATQASTDRGAAQYISGSRLPAKVGK
jgi:hypothetical protein